MGDQALINRLLASYEPAIRYKTLVKVLGRPEEDPDVAAARETIRHSERVRELLSQRSEGGSIPGNPYAKWTGAHWVLALLADLGYPTGDPELIPLRDHVYCFWLSSQHTKERLCTSKASTYALSGGGVPVMEGRARRCGSQEGNALYSTLALGIADERADQLAANLIRWQWPDGGWNCDRRPEAKKSSFNETILPIRALSLHGKLRNSKASLDAAERAADIFLKRRMFRKLSDGSVIHPTMAQLHYPPYWHYDILIGLKVMAEAGFIGDPRCGEALDVLESKRLQDGGFPAEGKYYQVGTEAKNGVSRVDWGGVSKKSMNEHVTVDALGILVAAGRLSFH